MATRHSSRPSRPAGRSRPKSRRKPLESPKSGGESGRKPAEPPSFHAVLGHFNDALAIVVTALTALENALETSDQSPEGFAEAMITMEFGVKDLLSVYKEFDAGSTHFGRAES